MVSMNLIDITISKINGIDYGCIISEKCKHEAIEIMQNIDLLKKVEKL